MNIDLDFEQGNIVLLFKMVVDYAIEIDHKVPFLIESKPMETSKYHYDFDAATVMVFLQKYDLTDHFKLNLEVNHATLAGHTFEHELAVAQSYDALGSIDANQGDVLLGWDADKFPTNLYDVTLAMYQIIEHGGIVSGGINFDAKVRHTSSEMDNLFLAHIADTDTFARSLKGKASLIKKLNVVMLVSRLELVKTL